MNLRGRAATDPPVPPNLGRVRFSWPKSIWLWGHGIATLFLLPEALDGPRTAWALVLTYVTLCLGHSVGLHRGLIHRTYEASRPVRRVLVGLFVLTGLGGPLSWIRLHRVRDHWQNRLDCPAYFAYRHGLARDFWWNLHHGFTPASWEPYGLDRALEQDGLLRFLERTWWLWILASYGLQAWLFGPEAAVVCGVARTSGGIVGHWFIGYWTHKHGVRRFTLPGASEHGSNSLLLGWVSFGEGFHNNHHALPDSARMGILRREFDLGWVTILGLEWLGLVTGVRSWSRGILPRIAADPHAGTPSRSARTAPPGPFSGCAGRAFATAFPEST